MARLLLASAAAALLSVWPSGSARACTPRPCTTTTLLSPKVPANTKAILVMVSGATVSDIELRGGDGRSIPASMPGSESGPRTIAIDGPLIPGEKLTLSIAEACAGSTGIADDAGSEAGSDATTPPPTKLEIEVGPEAPTPLAPTASFGPLRSTTLRDALPGCLENGGTGWVEGNGVAVDVLIKPSASLEQWGPFARYTLIVDGASYSSPVQGNSSPPNVVRAVVANCGAAQPGMGGWFVAPGEHQIDVIASVYGFGDQKVSAGKINLRCDAEPAKVASDEAGSGCSAGARTGSRATGIGVLAVLAACVAIRRRPTVKRHHEV